MIGAIILASQLTFQQDIRPLVMKRCMPCHTGAIQTLPNFLIYEEAYKNRYLIKKRVYDEESMPPGNSTQMTDKERETIKKWIDQGAKK